MTKTNFITILAALVIILGVCIWANHSVSSLQSSLDEAQAKLQEDALVEAGWIRASSVSVDEVELPNLQGEVQAAEQAQSLPVLAVNSTSQGSVVDIPLPPQPCPPPEDQLAPVIVTRVDVPESNPSSSPSSLQIHLDPSLQMRVDLNAANNVFYTGKILVRLRVPELAFDNTSEHPLTNATLALGDEIKNSLEYYVNRPPTVTASFRHPRYWRFGWSAGPAVLYNPFTREFDGGVALMWGVQF